MSPLKRESDRRTAMSLPRPFPALYRRAGQIAIGGRKYRRQAIRRFVLQPDDVISLDCGGVHHSSVITEPSILVVRQHPTHARLLNLWAIVNQHVAISHLAPNAIRGACINGNQLDLPVGRDETNAGEPRPDKLQTLAKPQTTNVARP